VGTYHTLMGSNNPYWLYPMRLYNLISFPYGDSVVSSHSAALKEGFDKICSHNKQDQAWLGLFRLYPLVHILSVVEPHGLYSL